MTTNLNEIPFASLWNEISSNGEQMVMTANGMNDMTC